MNYKMIGWQSLKTRLMVIELCIFILCIWSLTLISSQIMRGQMEKTLRDQQFSTVSLIAEGVNTEISERLQALQQRAQDMQSQILQDPVQLQSKLEDRLALRQMFNGGLFITDANGIAIASVPKSLQRTGLSFIDRDFILAALKEGKTTVGKPVIGKK